MFEQSVLDNSRQARSKWSWMGLVIQAGLVTGMLLIPMLSPEILGVMLPTAGIYVPVKPVAPVEVEVHQRSAATANTLRRSTHETHLAIELLAERPAFLGPMVTHRTPLENIQRAFAGLEAYKDGVGKSVVQLA